MTSKAFLCFCGLFIPRHSIYRYGTGARRNFKKRFGLTGLVEDHHVIPKQWRNHEIIVNSGYNISESYNIIMMPSHGGIHRLNTRRILHSGGHPKYNQYVKRCLDSFESEEELVEFVGKVKYGLRTGDHGEIPWK